MRMRTGKRRSADVINPRELPCIVFLIRSIRRLHDPAGVSSRLAPALRSYAMNAKADLNQRAQRVRTVLATVNPTHLGGSITVME
jgi:hypothetical protein